MGVVIDVIRASFGLGVLVYLVLRNLRNHPDVARAGNAAVREFWLRSVGAAHLALLVVLAAYLAVVGVNTAAYDYSFWNDPPPSSAADATAVISLWGLYVFVCFVAVVAYGWMCNHVASGRVAGVSNALRRALPAAPVAVVAFAAIFVTLPVGLPAAGLIAILGAAPFRTGPPASVSWKGYWAFVRSNFSPLLAAGLAVSILAIPIDVTLLLGVYVTENYNGPIEATVVAMIWLTVVLAALAAGWADGAFRHIWHNAKPTSA